VVQQGKIYYQVHDPLIPLRATGNMETHDFMGITEMIHEYQEVITPSNKNWCKGEIIKTSTVMAPHPHYN
jgi:hypothetical protein